MDLRPKPGSVDPDVLHSLQAVLDGPLKAQAWCGGVLAVSASAFAPILIAHGHHTYDRQRRVRTTDYFDLASLTKVVGTTTAAMLAVDRDALDLDISLGSYLPEFLAVDCADAVRRARVTPRHLLTHTSGLPAHIAFHRDPPASPRRRLLRLCGTALSADPGTVTVYSDIGMMLMGLALDRVFRRPWPRELQQAVFSPLGMRRTRFCLPAALRSRAVPTECRPESGLPWQGIVHDENARWLGGIAGHAGLFATAGDLCRFARMLLRRGQGEKVRVLSEAAITLFTRPAALVEGSSRCLGWDSPSALCSGGEHLSPASFGHTGFTGTSLWIDPQADLAVVLLTNAVHPRRECRSEHGFFDWRRRVHSAVYEVLGVSDRAHSDRTDQA